MAAMDLTLPATNKVALSSTDHTPDHNLIVNAIIAISNALGPDPSPMLSLPTGDAVPGGTPVGTIIVRY